MMKHYLFIFMLLLIAGSLVAQTPTVGDLTTTSGSNIKWYAASTGGSALATSTVLVNGTTYYASQTVNGVESTLRLAVTATVTSCTPSVTTSSVSSIVSTTATFNGNITAINGATVTVRGFKYSTINGFNPATTGTNVSESGSFSTGVFTANLTGLISSTTYYVCAYATNSAGTTYGSQLSFNTLIQTDYSYTGAPQTMTIPIGITQLTLMVWGAQGASSFNPGGKGGYAVGYLTVTPGQIITLVVGGQPAFNNASGYHTGGWPDGGQGWYNGQSGGGSSYVMYGGSKVIVAGGGGGANVFDDTPGAGGGTNGGNASSGGGGGTQSGGGTANSVNAAAGSLGQGGYAGQSNNNGGGGGGGYYGGGGAENGVGGGGSAYTGGVTSGSTTAGQQTGNGRILISY